MLNHSILLPAILAFFSHGLGVRCSEGSGFSPARYESLGESERIVRGKVAEEGQFPYAVALYYNEQFICTGSIIAIDKVLTAAHCVYVGQDSAQRATDFYAIAGAVNRTDGTGYKITFSAVKTHENYSSSTLQNDIAYFTTDAPIPLNEKTIQTVCLAKGFPIDSIKNATAMGWGKTDNFQGVSDVLRYAPSKICPFFWCVVRYPLMVDRTQLCSDGLGTGACNGDSGGPLIHLNAGEPFQIGIASFGRAFRCGSFLLAPPVYTRVTAFVDWLQPANTDAGICTVEKS